MPRVEDLVVALLNLEAKHAMPGNAIIYNRNLTFNWTLNDVDSRALYIINPPFQATPLQSEWQSGKSFKISIALDKICSKNKLFYYIELLFSISLQSLNAFELGFDGGFCSVCDYIIEWSSNQGSFKIMRKLKVKPDPYANPFLFSYRIAALEKSRLWAQMGDFSPFITLIPLFDWNDGLLRGSINN